MSPDFYGENTTDISGRGRRGDEHHSYGPAAATRATVTPPPQRDDTASWPVTADQDDNPGRFERLQPEAGRSTARPESPHVRMLPVLLGVIVVAALIVGAAFGLVYLISGDSGSGISVKAGDCVKQKGTEAVTASCSDAGAFEIVSIVDTKEQCADPGQPYVLNPTGDGRTKVLCLKPRG